MIIDMHVHSNVSFDAKNTREEMALFALKSGISKMCFTDHYDVINENSELVLSYNWEKARNQHENAQKIISNDSTLQLLYGIELGNAPADFSAASSALCENGLDFVIGAIHNTSLGLKGLDYYDVGYENNMALALQHLEDYFVSLHALISWGQYDTLGHLPYPLHYMRDRDGLNLHISDFREQYFEVLRKNAEKGCAIEVNSDRGKDSLKDYEMILMDWKAVGGEYITIGSDAHKSIDIGKGILKAYELVKKCGFKYITYYEKRVPICIKL